jgi:RNA polymerase sigma factor (sigma-70 family)
MISVEPDDRQLLLAMHRGHEASARLLWRRHAPCLLAHARAILREPGAAEDVVQAVMCRLLELPRSRLVAVSDPRAFLAAAVRREALNHLRAARRQATRYRHLHRQPDAVFGPNLLSDDLAPALDALPRRLREIVVLKHIGGLTFDQIALALEANRNTIAGQYRAALAALRAFLEPLPAAQGASHG